MLTFFYHLQQSCHKRTLQVNFSSFLCDYIVVSDHEPQNSVNIHGHNHIADTDCD